MAEKLATVAVIGSGGAESALVQKYSKSPHVGKILAIPGNLMMQEASEKPVEIFPNINVADSVKVGILCHEAGANLVDIRQERAIEAGLTNQLRRIWKIPVVGPTREAGKLEWDKGDARSFGEYFKLPQPHYSVISFKDLPYGKKFPDYYERVLAKYDEGRFFVKAAGLFDGKGVIETHNRREIENAIAKLRQENARAAETILIEDPLIGEELSAFAISDSRNFIILGYAQDHKRAYEGDKGPNTGGMGAISHPLLARSQTLREGVQEIVKKTIEGSRMSGISYRGVLYPGLMVENDIPSVVEFNCRWGDPEAQVIIPGLYVDFFEMGMEAAGGTLRRIKVSDDGKVRVDVAVTTKEGFDPKRKVEIKGMKELKKLENITLYGARVGKSDEKYWIAGSGRVFHMVATGSDVVEARTKLAEGFEILESYDAESLYARKDIGWRDVERLEKMKVQS